MDEDNPYKTQAEHEPELAAAPVLVPTPPRVGLKHFAIYVPVLVFAIFIARFALLHAQGGKLVCSRPQNRCEIDNGWLIHDREQFAADELEEAKVVWSHGTSSYTSGVKNYGVEVITRSGSRKLGGETDDHAEHNSVAATINAFAKDTSATSLDVHVAPGTMVYVLVGLIGFIYGLYGVALLVGLGARLRGRTARA